MNPNQGMGTIKSSQYIQSYQMVIYSIMSDDNTLNNIKYVW